MGTDAQKLPKGIYILNGKKVVIPSDRYSGFGMENQILDRLYGRGYSRKLSNTMNFDLNLTQKLDFITEGLSIDVKGAYNTDYFGVIKTFEKMKLELKNKEVYILGTGGASLAVAKALKDLDAKFFFVSRNIYDKKDFPFANKLIDYNELENRKGYLLINATPIGTTPNTNISPVSKQTIENFNILFDLIYNPRETLFLRWGKELGKQVENGLYMLVAQAVKSQEIWFDKKLDYNKIYELIQEEL